MSKIPRELRFAGVSLVLASQVASSTVGIPTELRANLPAKVLLGPKPTENNRRLALANHDHGPDGARLHRRRPRRRRPRRRRLRVRGQDPGVFKAFFNQPPDLASWLGSLGLPTCEDPTPTAAQLAQHVPTLAPDVPATSHAVRQGRR